MQVLWVNRVARPQLPARPGLAELGVTTVCASPHPLSWWCHSARGDFHTPPVQPLLCPEAPRPRRACTALWLLWAWGPSCPPVRPRVPRARFLPL